MRSNRAPTRSRPRRFASLALVASFAISWPTALPRDARADSTPSAAAVDEGRAHFQKGVGYFRVGDFRAALAEFNRANAVAPSFRIQFNIGQTCAELQDVVCATRAFQAFLDEGGKQVPPNQRTVAERELKRLQPLVGSVKVVVDVSGADVAVDGVSVGTSPLPGPVVVAVGRRKITAKRDDLGPISTTVNATANEMAIASLGLGSGDVGAPPPDAGGSSPSRAPFWIGVSVTGALTVATVAFGVASLGAKSDLDTAAGRFGVSAAELDDARSKVDNLAIATDVFFGAAIIAAGVTTYLFFKTKPSSTQAFVGPGNVALRHSF